MNITRLLLVIASLAAMTAGQARGSEEPVGKEDTLQPAGSWTGILTLQGPGRQLCGVAVYGDQAVFCLSRQGPPLMGMVQPEFVRKGLDGSERPGLAVRPGRVLYGMRGRWAALGERSGQGTLITITDLTTGSEIQHQMPGSTIGVAFASSRLAVLGQRGGRQGSYLAIIPLGEAGKAEETTLGLDPAAYMPSFASESMLYLIHRSNLEIVPVNLTGGLGGGLQVGTTFRLNGPSVREALAAVGPAFAPSPQGKIFKMNVTGHLVTKAGDQLLLIGGRKTGSGLRFVRFDQSGNETGAVRLVFPTGETDRAFVNLPAFMDYDDHHVFFYTRDMGIWRYERP